MRVPVTAFLCLAVIAFVAANQRKGCTERGGECRLVKRSDKTCPGGVRKLDCAARKRCCLPEGAVKSTKRNRGNDAKKIAASKKRLETKGSSERKGERERGVNDKPLSKPSNEKNPRKNRGRSGKPKQPKGRNGPRRGKAPGKGRQRKLDKPGNSGKGRRRKQDEIRKKTIKKDKAGRAKKPKRGKKTGQNDKEGKVSKPDQNDKKGKVSKPDQNDKEDKAKKNNLGKNVRKDGRADKSGKKTKKFDVWKPKKRIQDNNKTRKEKSGKKKSAKKKGPRKDAVSTRQKCRLKKQCKQLKGKCQAASKKCNGEAFSGSKFCSGSCSCCVKKKQLCKEKSKCKKKKGICQFKWDSCDGQKLKKSCKGSSTCVCCAPKTCTDKKKQCKTGGGTCVLKKEDCAGQVDSSLCGKFCKCCISPSSEVTAIDPETDNIVSPNSEVDGSVFPIENITLPDISLDDLLLKLNLSDVHFLLWTRSNAENSSYYELIIDDVSNLKASPFDKEKPTVILTHGYQGNGKSSWIYQSKTEYLKYQECNFIAIDWRKIAGHIFYPEIVNNLPEVGKHVAAFVNYLQAEGGLNITSVYAIGHSLGAHLISIMGSNIPNGTVGRITGLDPAGPGFELAADDKKLEKSDALFVDIIHSHACSFSDLCLGLNGSYGHVDFFPNGGRRQPGCTLLGDLFDTLASCSHRRSRTYWIESINGKSPFRSVPCSDWDSYKAGKCTDCGQGCLEMGVHVNTQLRGNYFLSTRASSPYAKG